MKSCARRLARLLAVSAILVLGAVPAQAAVPAGPDVSSHNHPSGTSIDWYRVQASGAPFAFVKATEGVTYTNPYFVADWNGVAAAGMVRGPYHYARPALPLSTAVDQANAFISYTGTTNEPGDLPPALDMEEAGGLSPANLIAWTHSFLDTVQGLTGRLPIIYTYPYFWKTAMGNNTGFTQYPLWIADYNGGTAPGTPLVGGWSSWAFWQYTASSTIDGITGAVDASTFCCGSAALSQMSFGGAPAAIPPPSAPPSPTPTTGLPGAPGSVAATAGSASATVRWTAASAPADDPVTSYTVTPRRAGVAGPARVFTDGGTSQSLTGLTNGSAYTFTVSAGNSAGSGPVSAPSSPVTPQATPLTSRSDLVGTGPTSAVPLVVTVLNPAGDQVSIDRTTGAAAPAGYAPTTVGATLTAPASSSLGGTATFSLHASALPKGTYLDDLAVFRNGVRVPTCQSAGATPCVARSTFDGTALTVTVSSLPTGQFSFAAARVGRVFGPDRVATAIASSIATYPGGRAGAVVLARADAFADALSGTPLAAARRAPLLLTAGAGLDSRTAAEISRVLPQGGTVSLLGGTAALGTGVADALTARGFQVVRYAGRDRYSTAVAVAAALGSPSTVFLATGNGFADGLSAGTAAARVGAALLLTDGSSLPGSTLAYLRAHPGQRYAVGGAAAAADSIATPLVGADRYETAVKVARTFFHGPGSAGIASGATFPDALSAGPELAALGSPLLLAAPTALPLVVAAYLRDIAGSAQVVHLHGGSSALSDDVRRAVGRVLGG